MNIKGLVDVILCGQIARGAGALGRQLNPVMGDLASADGEVRSYVVPGIRSKSRNSDPTIFPAIACTGTALVAEVVEDMQFHDIGRQTVIPELPGHVVKQASMGLL